MKKRKLKNYPDSYDPTRLHELCAIVKWLVKPFAILTALVLVDYAIDGEVTYRGVFGGLVMFLVYTWIFKNDPGQTILKQRGPMSKAEEDRLKVQKDETSKK